METFIKEQLYSLIQKNPDTLDFIYKVTIDWYGSFESGEFKKEWVNSDFLIKLGYSINDIENNNICFNNLVFKEDLAKINNVLLNIKDEINFDLPVRYHHKDGVIIKTKFKGIVLKDSKNKTVILGSHDFLAYFIDGKKEKALNEQLNLINIGLKNKNKELKQFSYLASHDLQQPINNIISYLSILEESRNDLNELGQLSLDVIKKSSYKMKNYITSLLEYSLIGTKQEYKEIDLEEVLISIKEIFTDRIKEQKAIVDFRVGKKTIIGFKNDIQLLFLNLIENSLKFSRKDVIPKIKIECKSLKNDFLFSISDNGIGIETDFYEKIFDIYFTIDRDDNYTGTGMGLAQCKKIVQLYGGKIWLESKKEQGSTFYFTVPKKSSELVLDIVK